MNDPLTPLNCDLRAYDWFPFYHKRMRQSAFWKRASDAVCRISVEFWSEAYEQVPAGSLPDDDVQLSDWAGFGRRNLSEWLAIKEDVMCAWVKCDDGRWYHPTLCEVALTAWEERQDHLRRRAGERQRKEDYRKRRTSSDGPVENVGQDLGQNEVSHGTSEDFPPENALKGTVTGTGTRILSSEANASSELRANAPKPKPSNAKASASDPDGLAHEEPDPDKQAWALAKLVLMKQGGLTDRQAGAFFGGLLKRFNLRPSEMIVPLMHAEDCGTLEPQPYLTQAAQNLKTLRLVHDRSSPDAKRSAFADKLSDVGAAMQAAARGG
jgi:hypothetical protein